MDRAFAEDIAADLPELGKTEKPATIPGTSPPVTLTSTNGKSKTSPVLINMTKQLVPSTISTAVKQRNISRATQHYARPHMPNKSSSNVPMKSGNVTGVVEPTVLITPVTHNLAGAGSIATPNNAMLFALMSVLYLFYRIPLA